MTDLDTLARAATQELLERTAPDLTHRYDDLRRIRARRTTAKLATVAAAVALAAGGWQLAGGGREPDDIRPVAPVHLQLDDARISDTNFLTSVRTVQRGDTLDHDRFDGITADGLVVRSRYTYDGDLSEYGLLDPATGDTDWLPRPPWDLGDPVPLRLSSDRLVYLDNRHAPDRFGLLTFDRATRTWQRPTFTKPPGVERFFGFTSWLGDDDRVYLMDPGPQLRWFSIGPEESQSRPEPELDGQWLAFTDTARLTVDRGGRLVVTREGGSDPQVVTDGLPEGCELERDSTPTAVFAGDRPVLSLPCRTGSVTRVFDRSGELYLDVAGEVTVGGSGPSHLLLTNEDTTYSLNLARRELYKVDGGNTGGFPGGRDVVGDLALWAVDGATGPDVFDLHYWVAHLP